ncbi:MAG TPA: DUF4231 domain-containing protein [Polyangiaceae bacterium]|nr:DUF4231 domain-containing protein [Polyangiaceae bacterium]
MVTDASSDSFVRPLRELVEQQVLPLIAWYQRKKRWPRRLHKATTAGVIILGALIPIASAWSGSTAARLFVGIIGVVITVITSLAASYDWFRRWRLFTVAQARLESELAKWEFAIARARMLPEEEGRGKALDATAALLEVAESARSEETEAFFENQRDPAAIVQPTTADG